MNKTILLITLVIATAVVCSLFFLPRNQDCSEDFLTNALQNKDYNPITICATKEVPHALRFACTMSYKGKGVDQDTDNAIKLCKAASVQGDTLATLQLAEIYSSKIHQLGEEHSPATVAECIKLYEQAIEKNDKYKAESKLQFSQFVFFILYSQEECKNLTTTCKGYLEWSKKLLLEAAEEGSTEAMLALAASYRPWQEVDFPGWRENNPTKALYWIEKAAQAGSIKAMHELGRFYAQGELSTADYEKATYWFKRAYAQGDTTIASFLKPNPHILGMEITKTTINEFIHLFPENHISLEQNPCNGGSTFFIDSKHSGIEYAIGKLQIVFNKDGILDAIIVPFEQDKYEDVAAKINSEYNPHSPSTGIHNSKGYVNAYVSPTFGRECECDKSKEDRSLGKITYFSEAYGFSSHTCNLANTWPIVKN